MSANINFTTMEISLRELVITQRQIASELYQLNRMLYEYLMSINEHRHSRSENFSYISNIDNIERLIKNGSVPVREENAWDGDSNRNSTQL